MIIEFIFNGLRGVALWVIELFPEVYIDFATWTSGWSSSFLGQVKYMMNYFLGLGVSNGIVAFIFIAGIGIVAFGTIKLVKFLIPIP